MDEVVSVGWFLVGAEEAGMKGSANVRRICRRNAAETEQNEVRLRVPSDSRCC